MLGTVEAIEAAVVAALQEEFGYTACAVLRAGPEANSRTPGTHALGVAIEVAREPWATLWSERDEPMGDADERLLEMVAAHVGAAVDAAQRREALAHACRAAAGALAGAAGASDRVRTAVAAGRRLMTGRALHDLALASVLLSAPPAGPPPEDLAGALALLRHATERWDGAGTPDGLAGEEDPARGADPGRLRRAAAGAARRRRQPLRSRRRPTRCSPKRCNRTVEVTD